MSAYNNASVRKDYYLHSIIVGVRQRKYIPL